MNNLKQQQLISSAKSFMERSNDPIHDLDHVQRVVAHVERLAQRYHLNKEQTDALVLAAWWHDVARSITKRPSIILMPFFDDIISALMLWYATIRHGLFGSVVGMATRMIFCKSIGTGKILTKLLIRKKNRLMIDILEDADTLDILHIERTKKLFLLADRSKIYHMGYRLTIWWYLSTSSLEMRTRAAKEEILRLVKSFFQWMQQQEIQRWHAERFGQKWVNRQVTKAELLIQKIEQQLLSSPVSL